jgi:hypothetical protein
MNFQETIALYASNVLSYHLVESLLQDYKRPNDKISELLKDGQLVSLKKGLYMVGDKIKLPQPEPFLIANHLLGPSYVSLDSALSWYGFIPERVYTVSSITTKSSRTYSNAVGEFEYIYQAIPYYSVGISQVQVAEKQFVMMAIPEKALFDKIVTTAGLQFNAKKDVSNYLFENLRIEEEKIKTLDVEKMKSWLEISPKKNSLSLLIKTLENL